MSGRPNDFSRAVKVATIRRATKEGLTYCEGCGAPVMKWRIDHRRAAGLLGAPTLENAQLLGPCCYAAKDSRDTRMIALAKRQEAYALGLKRPGKKLRARPKAPKPAYRPCAGKPRIAREYGL